MSSSIIDFARPGVSTLRDALLVAARETGTLSWPVIKSVVSQFAALDPVLREHETAILAYLEPRVASVLERTSELLGGSLASGASGGATTRGELSPLQRDAGSPPVCVSSTSIDVSLSDELDEHYAAVKGTRAPLGLLVSVDSICDDDRAAQLRVLRDIQLTSCWRVVRLLGEYLLARSCPILASTLARLSSSLRDAAPSLDSDQVRAAHSLLQCLPVDPSRDVNHRLRGCASVGAFLRYASAMTLDRYQIGGTESREWCGDATDMRCFVDAYRAPASGVMRLNMAVPCVPPGIASTLLLDPLMEQSDVCEFFDNEMLVNIFGEAVDGELPPCLRDGGVLEAMNAILERELVLSQSSVALVTCVRPCVCPDSDVDDIRRGVVDMDLYSDPVDGVTPPSSTLPTDSVSSHVSWDLSVRFMDFWVARPTLRSATGRSCDEMVAEAFSTSPETDVVLFPPLAPLGGMYQTRVPGLSGCDNSDHDRVPCIERVVEFVDITSGRGAAPVSRAIELSPFPLLFASASRLSTDFAVANELCARVDASPLPPDTLFVDSSSFDASLRRFPPDLRGYDPVSASPTEFDAAAMRGSIHARMCMPASAFALSWLVREWSRLAMRSDIQVDGYVHLRMVLFSDIVELVVHAAGYHPMYLEVAVLLGLVRARAPSDSDCVLTALECVLPNVLPATPPLVHGRASWVGTQDDRFPAQSAPVIPPAPVRVEIARVASTLNVFALVLAGYLVVAPAASMPSRGVVVPRLVLARASNERSTIVSVSGSDGANVYADLICAARVSVVDWGVFARMHACEPNRFFDAASGVAREMHAWGVCAPGPSLLASSSDPLPCSELVVAAHNLAVSLDSSHVSSSRDAHDMLVRDLTLAFGAPGSVGAMSDDAQRLYASLTGVVSPALDTRAVARASKWVASTIRTRDAPPVCSADAVSTATRMASLARLVHSAIGPMVVDGECVKSVRRLDSLSGAYPRPFRSSDPHAAASLLRVSGSVPSDEFLRTFVAIGEDLYDARHIHRAREACALVLTDAYEPPSCPFGVTRVLHVTHQYLSRVLESPDADASMHLSVNDEYRSMLSFVCDGRSLSAMACSHSSDPDVRLAHASAIFYEAVVQSGASLHAAWSAFVLHVQYTPGALAAINVIVRACIDGESSEYDIAHALMNSIVCAPDDVVVRYVSSLSFATQLMLVSFAYAPSAAAGGELFDLHTPLDQLQPAVLDARRRAFFSAIMPSLDCTHDECATHVLAALFRDRVCRPVVAAMEMAWIMDVGPCAISRVFGVGTVSESAVLDTAASVRGMVARVAAAYAVSLARTPGVSVSSPLATCVYLHSMKAALSAAHEGAVHVDRWSGSFPCARAQLTLGRFLPTHGPRSAVATHIVLDVMRLLHEHGASDPFVERVLCTADVSSMLRRDADDGQPTGHSDEDLRASVRMLVYALVERDADLVQRQNDFRDSGSVASLCASYVLEAVIDATLVRAVEDSRASNCVVVRTSRRAATDLCRVVCFASHVFRQLFMETSLVKPLPPNLHRLYPPWVDPVVPARPTAVTDLIELAQAHHSRFGDTLPEILRRVFPMVAVMLMRVAVSTPSGRASVLAWYDAVCFPPEHANTDRELCVAQLYYVLTGVVSRGGPPPTVLPLVLRPDHRRRVVPEYLRDAHSYIESVLSARSGIAFVRLLHDARVYLDVNFDTWDSLIADLHAQISVEADRPMRAMTNVVVMLLMIDSLRAFVGHVLATDQWRVYRDALVRAHRALPSLRDFDEPLLVLPISESAVYALRASYGRYLFRRSNVYRSDNQVQCVFAFLGAERQ